jgi:hypothetical protein
MNFLLMKKHFTGMRSSIWFPVKYAALSATNEAKKETLGAVLITFQRLSAAGAWAITAASRLNLSCA